MQLRSKQGLSMAISALLVLSFLGGARALAQSGARLQVTPPAYEFGTIGRLKGVVSASFLIKNEWDSPLVIMKIQPT